MVNDDGGTILAVKDVRRSVQGRVRSRIETQRHGGHREFGHGNHEEKNRTKKGRESNDDRNTNT